MAIRKLSGIGNELTAPAKNDIILVTDVSDKSGGTGGTSKEMQLSTLQDSLNEFSGTVKTVAATGADYTTITAALADITDATVANQYLLLVEDGTYTENGPSGLGLVLKDYIHIRGSGRNRVTIKGPEAAPGSEVNYDTIHRGANCIVESVGLVAYKNKYAVHLDAQGQSGFVLRDFKTIHYGGVDGYEYDFGIGLRAGETITIENGDCGGKGVFIHGDFGSRVSNTPWTMNVRAVTAKELRFNDFQEYEPNILNLDGCEFERAIFAVVETYKDANPGDPLYDRGYDGPFTQVNADGCRVGRIEYLDAYTIDTVLVNPLVISGTNKSCINKGGSTIAQGKAVKMLTEVTAPDTYPTAFWSRNNVAAWDGSGIFGGWAEVEMLDDALGSIAIPQGFPKALANGTTAISYGDALELNSSGELVQYSSGEIVAYAREALASGTAIIEIAAK